MSIQSALEEKYHIFRELVGSRVEFVPTTDPGFTRIGIRTIVTGITYADNDGLEPITLSLAAEHGSDGSTRFIWLYPNTEKTERKPFPAKLVIHGRETGADVVPGKLFLV